MRYSIHDGPGIRTTVFFKGCPMSCVWCHNPESISRQPQNVFNSQKCINCGYCGQVNGAAATDEAAAAPVATSGKNCPTGARETIGYEISCLDLMKEINKDRLFYEQSGGGVTFSGGEPFYQDKFLLTILESCREDYINTAIDTSGFCDTASIMEAAKLANYFLYDVKFIDSEKHEKYCGVSNEIVLKNLHCLSETKTNLLIRIPVIPAVNDDIPEMTAIFQFIKDFKNITSVHLLPYHNIHVGKYRKIGKQYELSEISNDESQNMKEIKNMFETKFKTRIGG